MLPLSVAETQVDVSNYEQNRKEPMEAPNSARPSQSEAKRKVLIVEDEKDIRDLVRYNLEAEGFSVVEASDGEMGLALASRERPALVILDLMLPGLSGLEVCRKLRERDDTLRIPILILTARAAEVDKVLGLEMGADDYVTKPFSPRELAARVKAVLRRAYGATPDKPHEVYERGRLRIDFDTYEVFLDGQPLRLGLREFELLKFFLQYPNRVFSRGQILDLVWGQDVYVEPRTVDVHIRRLRQRLERDDANPTFIVTVRSVGYKCNPDALEE
jgi:phosphate regulon transcriptional regulator PhoB